MIKNKNEKTIKIMCIGDSITFGYQVPGSYRKFLYHYLIKNGYKINLIGAKEESKLTYFDETTGEIFEYEDGNSGYNAYSIKEYENRKGIYEMLKETKCLSKNPDIIILQIGTNNVMDNYNPDKTSKDFDLLLDYIFENIPTTTMLFVATIPDLDPNRNDVYTWFSNYRHSDDLTNYNDEEVEKKVKESLDYFNSDIISKVNKMQKLGKNIRIGNINRSITNVKTQLFDGVHPNNIGYKVMGEYWAKIIGDYLNENKSSNI